MSLIASDMITSQSNAEFGNFSDNNNSYFTSNQDNSESCQSPYSQENQSSFDDEDCKSIASSQKSKSKKSQNKKSENSAALKSWSSDYESELCKMVPRLKNDWKKISKKMELELGVKATPHFLKTQYKKICADKPKAKSIEFSHETDV